MIFVKANKDPAVYDTVDVKQGAAGDLNFAVRLRGHCPEHFHMLGGGLRVAGKTTQLDEAFQVNTDHRSIGPDHGAGWFYYRFSIPFVMPKLERSPVDVCNTELQRANGLSARAKLLQDGFDIKFDRAYKVEFGTICDRTDLFHDEDQPSGAETYYPAVIRCLPTGYKPSRARVEPQRTAVPDPPIGSISVLADPAETQGKQCPVNVTFRGKITASENSAFGTFKTEYRFIGENNFKTDWVPASVARGESRSVIWRRFIEAPENDRTGGFKTPGGKVKIPVYRGWMSLEVKLPNGTKSSERTAFSVDCNVQPRIRTKA